MTKIALIVDHALLTSVAEQRTLAEANGAQRAVEIAPRTGEDWHYRLREALGEATEANAEAIVVSSLVSLGLTTAQLFDGLEAISEAKLGLISIAEGIDTTADDSFLEHVGVLAEAIDAGRLILAREIIERASKRGPVSPPKAELVDSELWEQIKGK